MKEEGRRPSAVGERAKMIPVAGIRIVIGFAVAALASAGCAARGGQASRRVLEIGRNGSSSCRRSHNAGLYANGRTFLCWAGPKMQPCVGMYDHETGTWSETQVVHRFQSTDYHDYPVMVKGAGDHLHVFWAKHNGSLHYCRSHRPLDVRGEWTHQLLPARGATYPAPLVDAGGDLYVFYRGRGHATRSHFDYVKSVDNGRTWSTVEDAIAAKGDGFYLMHTTHEPARGGIPERLHLTWFLRRGNAHENVYFAYFVPGRDGFESVTGADLGARIGAEELDGECLVEKVTRERWSILSHYEDDGTPVVVYPRDGETICARWDGERWEKSEAPLGHEEIEKLGPRGFRMYAGGDGCLTWWQATDVRDGWRKAGVLDLPVDGISQCILIDNRDPAVELFLKQDDVWNPKTYDGTDGIFAVGRRRLDSEPRRSARGGKEDSGRP